MPNWAKPYVNFAYENDLTKGVSADKLGANDAVTAAQYLTFVLRAMGYVSGEDFDWSAVGADRPSRHHARRIQREDKQGLPARRRGVVSACALKAACKKRQNAL